jgi:hypothetical protein
MKFNIIVITLLTLVLILLLTKRTSSYNFADWIKNLPNFSKKHGSQAPQSVEKAVKPKDNIPTPEQLAKAQIDAQKSVTVKQPVSTPVTSSMAPPASIPVQTPQATQSSIPRTSIAASTRTVYSCRDGDPLVQTVGGPTCQPPFRQGYGSLNNPYDPFQDTVTECNTVTFRTKIGDKCYSACFPPRTIDPNDPTMCKM